MERTNVLKGRHSEVQIRNFNEPKMQLSQGHV